jgi:2-polyprenyl-3-methyl-5-hydroxy-6-metoxy-1,4-benzoquinol methylase
MINMNRSIKNANMAFWLKEYSMISYDFSPLSAESIDPVAKRLNESSCRTVLDLGCGLGRMSIALARLGFEVTAIDFVPSAIIWVQKWAQRENLSVKTDVRAAEELTAYNEYDAIYCNSVLDHMSLESARLSVRNIAKALRPNGIAYISFDGREPEDLHKYTILEDGTILYNSGRLSGKLWRFFSDSEIRELCMDFEIIEFGITASGKRRVWLRIPKSRQPV